MFALRAIYLRIRRTSLEFIKHEHVNFYRIFVLFIIEIKVIFKVFVSVVKNSRYMS